MTRAMELAGAGSPLQPVERARRLLEPGEIRIAIAACAVCRTDLHILDGELPDPHYPIVPGHEIIGHVTELGAGVGGFSRGDRVGVPWLGWTCGQCEYCRAGRENLCPNARFTGYQIAGGYASETIADARYVFPIPAGYTDVDAAPLMCAGLIGWRALKAAGDAPKLGFYGFGAAAHIAIQAARHRGQKVFAFVRDGDEEGKTFARKMGAAWAGDSSGRAPEPLDAALIFAPVGALVPLALEAIKPGSTVVCAGIHMSDIPAFPYAILWGERVVRSVANLTRRDGEEFLKLAGETRIVTSVSSYPLADANRALEDLRHGKVHGAAVLVP
ncbi:MAG TPA: zinc-dependent alcohol dehydrogenase family protein [Rhizomicrobium sp.]|nr:zinc-dependent alcohol dehydrogenase family protein [Rhizomicrobium sp.]